MQQLQQRDDHLALALALALPLFRSVCAPGDTKDRLSFLILLCDAASASLHFSERIVHATMQHNILLSLTLARATPSPPCRAAQPFGPCTIL